ncbi:MAG: hypothetical protein IPM79_02840 [Polyangiaceae bacterium]|nr:hypothetical protein [Polyangiaceae bacterium]
MAEPHLLFEIGPLLFVGCSFFTSLALSPAVTGLAERRFGPFEQRARAKALGLLATIAAVWTASTAAALLLLLVPVGESERGLPAERLDAAVIAHMVPTVATLAADKLVAQLVSGGSARRWSPPGAREERLVLAARIDVDTDRAIERLVAEGYRTHAGRFALSKPTGRACELGLDALAESLQGAALQELMLACHNAPGDPVGLAAFKVGDFMSAVGAGPENESIISRQLLTPLGEPKCFAQGPDLPTDDSPICRLEHAELHKRTRRAALDGLKLEAPFARRWRAAIEAELDQPLPDESLFTIDPVQLVERPFVAVMDEPIAVYEDLRERGEGALTPGQSAWVRIAIAAERSAAGRHDDAAKIVREAKAQLDLGSGASEAERRGIARLAAALAVRAGDEAAFAAESPWLATDDPLHRLAELARSPARVTRGDPSWAASLSSDDPIAIAEALDAAAFEVTRGGLYRLRALSPEARAALGEWLHQAFPACSRCGFFQTLDRLTVRMDAARALGDAGAVRALELILSRFEAVFLNRGLALSLRGADPEPL